MATILILEDEPINGDVFAQVLEADGHRVLRAVSGGEALKVSETYHHQIQILVSDVAVPDLSGTEVALHLVQRRPQMRILFVSGTPLESWTPKDRENLVKLLHHGVEILEKPFRPGQLEEKIDALARWSELNTVNA